MAECFEVRCSQRALSLALGTVTQAISSRATLPILHHVLLEATPDGRLLLQGTNLEIGMQVAMTAMVSVAGRTTAPASLLQEVVSSISATDTVHLAVDAQETNLLKVSRTQMRSASQLVREGLEASEFPLLPLSSNEPQEDGYTVVLPEAVREWIGDLAHAAVGDSPINPVLCGVYWRCWHEQQQWMSLFAASDSLSLLALMKQPLDQEPTMLAAYLARTGQPWGEAIIPASTCVLLARRLSSAVGPATLRVLSTRRMQVVFTWEQVMAGSKRETQQVWLVSRLIEGAYPNIESVFVGTRTTDVIVDRLELRTALKQIKQVAKTNGNTFALHANGEDECLMLAASSDERTQISPIAAVIRGQSTQSHLNMVAVQKALQLIVTPQVIISLNTMPSQVRFRPLLGDSAYIGVVLPVQNPSVASQQ